MCTYGTTSSQHSKCTYHSFEPHPSLPPPSWVGKELTDPCLWKIVRPFFLHPFQGVANKLSMHSVCLLSRRMVLGSLPRMFKPSQHPLCAIPNDAHHLCCTAVSAALLSTALWKGGMHVCIQYNEFTTFKLHIPQFYAPSLPPIPPISLPPPLLPSSLLPSSLIGW